MENDDEREELTAEERADIEADLDDLGAMRTIFGQQGVKGVVIACQDCGANHSPRARMSTEGKRTGSARSASGANDPDASAVRTARDL